MTAIWKPLEDSAPVLFTVGGYGTGIVVYRPDLFNEDPFSPADLEIVQIAGFDEERSEIWSSDAMWGFVPLKDGSTLLINPLSENRLAVRSPSHSYKFIEHILDNNKTTTKRRKGKSQEESK